ncbi:Crp/Fnr family transcriptional regulator [Streptomyces albireticuli]|uniref:Crp/Fnr family transcriptional regulator n=1 Tax=Streptomyces albireticuli TaxID=1940 RepID=UPI0036A56757
MTPPPNLESFHVSDVLAGRRRMPEGSFLDGLPSRLWSSMIPLGQTRAYAKGEPLPTGGPDSPIHIVLGGCVAQRRAHFGTTILRFRGTGQVLEEHKLVEPDTPGPLTTCLSKTVTLSFTAEALQKLLERHVVIERKLLRSLETRNRTDERIYSTFKRPALARVSTLLHHLGATVGVREQGPNGGIRVEGPSQCDLAEALLIGKSTVELALGRLRDERVIHNRYRAIVVRDAAALANIAEITERPEPRTTRKG